jgi:aspartyl-tRNA(Asn)/glutamyl-tRNA(Gln) amidotransferase subunit C
MKIDKETVQKISSLARITIPEEELDKYSSHLEKVLEYMKEINSVDTDGVEELINPMWEEKELFKNHRLREDTVKDSLGPEKILKNAPSSKVNQFVVDAVLDTE